MKIFFCQALLKSRTHKIEFSIDVNGGGGLENKTNLESLNFSSLITVSAANDTEFH